MGRVLAIGLDSVDEVDVLARIDAGAMPRFAALRARGTWCSLEVDPLCRAEYPWPTFATGRTPESLGRWTIVAFDPATYRYRAIGAPDVPPFWSVGDDAAVVSLDIPAAALTRGNPGSHVVDWAIHEPMYSRSSSPPDLLPDLEARFGTNSTLALEYAGTWHDGDWLKRYGEALVGSIGTRTEVVEHLLAVTPAWRLAVVVFCETHQVAHHTWHGVSPDSVLHDVPTAPLARRVLDDLHTAVDDAIGRLAAGLEPDDVVVVFSPKGSESICDVSSNVLTPELFHRLAFGRPMLRQPSLTRWERQGRPPRVLGAGADYASAVREAYLDPPWRRVVAASRRAAGRAAARVAPGLMDRRRRARRQEGVDAGTATPDPDTLAPLVADDVYDEWMVTTWYRRWWPEMAYFVLPSFSDLHVRINVTGRERDGIVAPEDYAATCDEVERVLRACRSHRTGAPLVAQVVRTHGDDPFAEVAIAADVVVSWAEDTDVLEHPDVGVVGPYPAWRSGGHGARAFALVSGGDIGPGTSSGADLVDLPATLLDLAGLAPHSPIDGTPMSLPRRQPAS